MPLLGLGTWEAAAGDVGRAVTEALAAGVRHFDCAAAYRNEAEVGRDSRSRAVDGAVSTRRTWLIALNASTSCATEVLFMRCRSRKSLCLPPLAS